MVDFASFSPTNNFSNDLYAAATADDYACIEPGCTEKHSPEEVEDSLSTSFGLLLHLPVTVVTGALDTTIGVIANLFATIFIGFGRENKEFTKMSSDFLAQSSNLLSTPLRSTVQMFHNEANFNITETLGDGTQRFKNGFLADKVHTYFQKAIDNCDSSEVWKKRKIYAKWLVSSILSRAADAPIAAVATSFASVAALFSLLTGKTSDKLNAVAFNSLQFTGVIYDINFCFAKILNPDANMTSPYQSVNLGMSEAFKASLGEIDHTHSHSPTSIET